ncbi:thioesterase II family protein [Paenibacillus sanguinis]|uniref:thioesterase II family protein n=1 Tax=Paenibacillus sanguinis TaxID=225906 RepID=UPI0003805268|nr:thioesterase domain-containing protein [Paenibacillus sanguinis]
MKSINLFCFPFAGGSSFAYLPWKRFLHPTIKLQPIELAGRGTRCKLPFYTDFKEAIDDTYEQVYPCLNEGQYVMFGHSMGALLVYALIERIRNKGGPPPEHLFFSGRWPPHIHKEGLKACQSNDELIQRILRFGGTPKEIFEVPELAEMYLEIFKADFHLIDTYIHNDHSKYDFDISILAGQEDPDVTQEDIESWKCYTSHSCHLVTFKGGHFYLKDMIQDVVGYINKVLVEVC